MVIHSDLRLEKARSTNKVNDPKTLWKMEPFDKSNYASLLVKHLSKVLCRFSHAMLVYKLQISIGSDKINVNSRFQNLGLVSSWIPKDPAY